MPMLARGVVAGIAAAIAFGGNWRRLATFSFRFWPLLVVAFLIREIASFSSGAPLGVYLVALAGITLVAALNWRLPGASLIAIGTAMLDAAHGVKTRSAVASAETRSSDNRSMITDTLHSGQGYEKFSQLVEAQGGSHAALERLPPSSTVTEVNASRGGFINGIDVVMLGNIGRALSSQDSAGGIQILKRVGERLEKGEPVARLFSKAGADDTASVRLSFEISQQGPASDPLIY